jgi:glycosyltransferase involved in cell wall biosynthesis
MRVAISSGTRTWGGLEQMTVHLALGLQAREHEVTVFSRKRSSVFQRVQGRVRCEPILRGGRFDPITLLRCSWALLRHRPAVLIGNTPTAPAWTGIVARLLGIPVVHRHEFNRPFENRRRDRLMFGWVPDVIVVNSEASRQTLLAAHSWLEPDRVRVIPNGVDVEALRGAAVGHLDVPPDAVVFGFVGRFEEQKGIVEIGEAWARVVEAVPNAHLVAAGWGHQEALFRNSLGGCPNVHILGIRDDVPSLMKRFDVLVAPFHNEGFGLVFVEAMAVGVPVVAARASSTPEVLADGIEGRLVPVRNANALAEAMIALARDPAARTRMGAAGAERARRDFSCERMVSEHERLFAELPHFRRPLLRRMLRWAPAD